jgi:plastocyanin
MRSAIVVTIASLSLFAYSRGFQIETAKASKSGKVAKHSQAAKKPRTVLIDQFLFKPQLLTVHVGETVEWKNAGTVPHTATSTDGKTFDSSSIASGGTWHFKAVKKGTFNYVCSLHPNMKGRLVVR